MLAVSGGKVQHQTDLTGAWAACEECAALIEVSDKEGLAARCSTAIISTLRGLGVNEGATPQDVLALQAQGFWYAKNGNRVEYPRAR